MKRIIVWFVVVAAVAAGAYFGYRAYARSADSAAAGAYRLAPVTRQTIVSSISATGTLVPEDVVDVGTQVNGLIATFGVDADGREVDYRSEIKADQVLATIDDAIYAADVAADEASLAQAQAQVKVAEATRDQAVARLEQARRDWARAERLGESQALSQADFDASKSAFDQATAALAVAESQIGQAQAQVGIAQAALARSRRNLFYCTIKSPVDGVIIDRRVEIGQTVVSSLNAPSLFLIAKDLKKMLVLVQVNEADIGHVTPGKKVVFTADAFSGERFTGEVRKVRLNATMTQNVVTYTVEIVTSNADLKLLPYLTANVRFIIDQRDNALAVPNAALRWAPPGVTDPAPAARSGAGPSAKPAAAPPGARVWVLRNNVPTPVTVTPGLSDGTVTEIATDELHEGDEVIFGQVATADASASGATTNPFAPPVFRGRGGGRPAGASSGSGGSGGSGGGGGGGGGGR